MPEQSVKQRLTKLGVPWTALRYGQEGLIWDPGFCLCRAFGWSLGRFVG